MRRILVSLGCMLAAQLGCAIPAVAADYFFIGQTGDWQILLLDPGTIKTANGKKTAHVAFVSESMLWNDFEMEFDCAGKRYRKMSAVSHPMMVSSGAGNWQSASKKIEQSMTDVVCKWPTKVMDSVSAPDFQTLIKRASNVLMQQQSEKKK